MLVHPRPSLPPFSGPVPLNTNIGAGLVFGGRSIERKGEPNRLLILAVSFADDEMQVLASQRIGSTDPAQLIGIFEACSGEADR